MIKITAKHTVKDMESDNVYTIIEEWQNIESLNNHFQTSHFKILSEKVKDYITDCCINKYEEVIL